MYENNKSIVHNRPRDCVGCRLVGGFGVLGAGLYIAKGALSVQKGYGRIVMLGVATCKISLYFLKYNLRYKHKYIVCQY